MIFRLLILLGLPVVAYYLVKSISARYQLSARQTRYFYFLTVTLLVVSILILLGRLPAQFILAPLGIAATFLLRMLPTLLRLLPMWQIMRSKLGSRTRKSSGNISTIKTNHFIMELDHDSGDLRGEVIGGQFDGQSMTDLSLEDLMLIKEECGSDQDSLQVLVAFLDRSHQDWNENGDGYQANSNADESIMSVEMAIEVLGIEGELNKESIQLAHRALMQKLHPDRGGSEYFAKKINQAKEVLLKSL